MVDFIDLHLRLPIEDIDYAEEFMTKSYELGYRSIGVPFPPMVSQNKIRKLRKTCSNHGLDLITRVDLSPKNIRDLLSKLRRLRRRFEIISVSCISKPVARQAAKDRRVDIVSFLSPDPRRRFFDKAEAELASKSLTALEVDMAPLLTLNGFPRIRLLSFLRKEVRLAEKADVPIIISSGTSEKYLLRKPQDYASLAYLFDLDHQTAIKALSKVPSEITERNRKKLSPEYMSPGVHIVRRGKGCHSV